MLTHRIKCERQYFQATKRGDKLFEVRRNDRSYDVGDILELIEIGSDGVESGETLRCRVTYHLHGGQFGIAPTCCVLGIQLCNKSN